MMATVTPGATGMLADHREVRPSAPRGPAALRMQEDSRWEPVARMPPQKGSAMQRHEHVSPVSGRGPLRLPLWIGLLGFVAIALLSLGDRS